MKKLKDDKDYPANIDKDVLSLVNVMNCIPGIETFESCSGHGKLPMKIWFEVKGPIGIFFLTRCTDKRYWKYGDIWKIELSVGDRFENGNLPTNYILYSGSSVGENAYKQSESLIENMNYHLNHKGFIKGYKIDVSKFKYLEQIEDEEGKCNI